MLRVEITYTEPGFSLSLDLDQDTMTHDKRYIPAASDRMLRELQAAFESAYNTHKST